MSGRAIKWAFDRLIALVLFVITLPLLLVLSIAAIADDGWPPLYVQRRIGKGGQRFPLLKLRSMVRDATAPEKREGITDDPYGVVADDPRITRVGRWLRRTGFDELPQLFNVLVGQMSFVGPRPDVPEQAANYSDHERRRLAVLPGITGWAQINGREEIDWPARFELDLWYVEHWSLWLDLRILVRTIGQVFREAPAPARDEMNVERSRKREEP